VGDQGLRRGRGSPEGIQLANTILQAITTTSDYTVGFSAKPSLARLNDDMRFFTLLRGSPGAEPGLQQGARTR
jgi:hypothetical protein